MKHYDFSGDQSGGGVMHAFQLCPKCEGQGIVAKPPYLPAEVTEWSSSESQWTCDLCNGKKVITTPELAATKEENERLRDELKGLAKTTGMVVTVQGKTLVEGVDFTCIGGTIILAKHVFA